MNTKNANVIATIVATVLCGCPGLLGLCFGGMTLVAGFTPGAEIDIFGSTDPDSATGTGALVLCLSLIAIAMPVIVWFATRRKGAIASIDDEPLPPAS